jgi:hypothetical protein
VDFFAGYWNWLRAEGYASVAWYVANYSIPADLDPAGLCHRAPETSSTAESIEASVGGIEAAIAEAINTEVVGFRGGLVSAFATKRLAHQISYRISDYRLSEILFSMGYEKRGQANRRLMAEAGTRPTLYAKPGVTVDYEEAQGYPRALSPTNP